MCLGEETDPHIAKESETASYSYKFHWNKITVVSTFKNPFLSPFWTAYIQFSFKEADLQAASIKIVIIIWIE